MRTCLAARLTVVSSMNTNRLTSELREQCINKPLLQGQYIYFFPKNDMMLPCPPFPAGFLALGPDEAGVGAEMAAFFAGG